MGIEIDVNIPPAELRAESTRTPDPAEWHRALPSDRLPNVDVIDSTMLGSRFNRSTPIRVHDAIADNRGYSVTLGSKDGEASQ